jgi:hypothetical protein
VEEICSVSLRCESVVLVRVVWRVLVVVRKTNCVFKARSGLELLVSVQTEAYSLSVTKT